MELIIKQYISEQLGEIWLLLQKAIINLTKKVSPNYFYLLFLLLFDRIMSWTEEGNAMGTVYLNSSHAFYMVPRILSPYYLFLCCLVLLILFDHLGAHKQLNKTSRSTAS